MRVSSAAGAMVLALQMFAGKSAGAQSPAAVMGSCSSMGTVVRTTGGAALGAWVAFVAAKIKLSDWNAGSQSPSAIRMRNRITIGGAVTGALIGHLMFRRHCGASRGGTVRTPPEWGSRRPITQDEITRSAIIGTAYDLVYALRRQWLNDRGVEGVAETPHVVTDADGNEFLVSGEPQLVIYLDDMKLGTVSRLREIAASSVIGVRYYNPSQATFRWGTGHAHGAIQVLSVTEPDRSQQPPQRFVAPGP